MRLLVVQLLLLSCYLTHIYAFVSHTVINSHRTRTPFSHSDAKLYSVFDVFIEKVTGAIAKVTSSTSSSTSSSASAQKQELLQLTNEINDIKKILNVAANTKATDSEKVIDSLLNLEKLMRRKGKIDEIGTANDLLKYLNGEWQLIFTTGTVDTQKKIGKINYFPIKAVQSFDTNDYTISNGIYIGDTAFLKFYGSFTFIDKLRKVCFDFDEIEVFGLRFSLPKGGAATLGAASGLGSRNNEVLLANGKLPFFNWISADLDIATARGGGGGLALWKRIV